MTNLLKYGVEITPEFRVFRAITNFMGVIDIESLGELKGLMFRTLKKMEEDGFILMADGFVEITIKGRERFEELKPEFYRF